MTNDPNKNQPQQHSGGHNEQEKQFEQQRRNPDDASEKRPQGGNDAERDQEKQDQGQRRAS